jgi:hypothetical protein
MAIGIPLEAFIWYAEGLGVAPRRITPGWVGGRAIFMKTLRIVHTDEGLRL